MICIIIALLKRKMHNICFILPQKKMVVKYQMRKPMGVIPFNPDKECRKSRDSKILM